MNQYYKEKLMLGLHYQDFVVEELYKIGLPIISYSSKEFQFNIGENKAGIEIKNDQNFRKTGNFYIEISEKSNPKNKNFIPSGIYRTDNTWLYLIGDEKDIYIFAKNQLVAIHKNNIYREVEIPTSRGFLFPVNDVIRKNYAIKVINCEEKE